MRIYPYLYRYLRDRKAYEGSLRNRQRHNLAVAMSIVTACAFSFWLWCTREYHIANPMQNIRRPKREPVVKAIDHADCPAL